MTSKECEEQLESLVEAWQLNEADLNQTDIEAIKHLILENQIQHKEINRLKQPTIFIDTQDMEERYGEGLYMDYLKEENQQLKDRINKAIEYIEKYKRIYDVDGSVENLIDEFNILASPKMLIKILKEDNKEKVNEN